jgi:hypothetical protein
VRFSQDLKQMQEVRLHLEQQPELQLEQQQGLILQQKVAAAGAWQLESPRPPPHAIADDVELMAPPVPGCLGLKCLELPAVKYSDDFVRRVREQREEQAAAAAAMLQAEEQVGGSVRSSEPWAALQLRDGGTPGSSMHKVKSGSMRNGSAYGGSMRGSLGGSMRSIGGSRHGILKAGAFSSPAPAAEQAPAHSAEAAVVPTALAPQRGSRPVSWVVPDCTSAQQAAEARAAAQAAAKAALGATVAALRVRAAAAAAAAQEAGLPPPPPVALSAAFEEVSERARSTRILQRCQAGRGQAAGSGPGAAAAAAGGGPGGEAQGQPWLAAPLPELHEHILRAAPLVEALAAQGRAAAAGGELGALLEVGRCCCCC